MQFSIIPVPESGNPENKKHDTVQLQGVGYVKPEHHAFLCAKAGKKPVWRKLLNMPLPKYFAKQKKSNRQVTHYNQKE